MIKVILADRDDQSREFDIDIEVYDNKLAHDWHQALKTDIIGKIHCIKHTNIAKHTGQFSFWYTWGIL